MLYGAPSHSGMSPPVNLTASRNALSSDNNAVIVNNTTNNLVYTIQPTLNVLGFSAELYQNSTGTIQVQAGPGVTISNIGGTFGPTTSIGIIAVDVNAYDIITIDGGIPGTNTNNNATAGNVGEFISATLASGAAIVLGNGAPSNVVSVNLTAGDWDVSSTVDFNNAGATSTDFRSGISLATGTLPTQPGGAGLGTDALAVIPLILTLITDVFTQSVSPVRLSIAATTQVFLVAQSSFSAGAISAYGTLRARRMR